MKHVLIRRNNTVYLALEVENGGKTRKIILARVHGWKAELAYSTLNFKPDGWNEDVSRAYVGLNALRIARDEWTARKYLNKLKEMMKLELHFWAVKFSRDRLRADRAWRSFYND